MKGPLVIVALLYCGGLLLGEFFHPPVLLLFAVTLGLAVAALVWNERREALLWPLVIFTGWTNMVRHAAVIPPHDLRALKGGSPALVSLRGTLVETPSQRLHLRDDREFSRSIAQIRVTHTLSGTNWNRACGRILVLTPGILPPEFFAGQTVEIEGVLGHPPGPVAEGLFDYRAYLKRLGIYYQLKAESTNDWRLLSSRTIPPLGDRFLAWAQRVLSMGLSTEDDSLHLLWAMTLGWKTSITNETYEPFMQSGTMHIFAISGLHIALISGILVSLLRFAQMGRAWCGAVVIPLIWFYTGATGWQSSAIRSALMMTIIIGGWALARPSNLINSLAAAAFIILLWDPQQLFQASFQLSFFVVLSIGLLLPPFEKLRDRLFQPNPWLPEELTPWWRRQSRTVLYWLASSLATSLAAWLGSLPLTALYFHLFSPVTLLANLFIVPLSGFALACNLGSLICGEWLPWATELFNYSAWGWMKAMMQLSHWATAFPKGYLYVREPALALVLVYYAVLLAALSPWFWATKGRAWTMAGAAAAFLALSCAWESRAVRNQASLTVIPMNGGEAIYLSAPEARNDLLVDCGTTNSVEFIVKPFLHGQGINRLPGLVLTHGDLHHIGGAKALDDLFSIQRVYASDVPGRSAAYRRNLAELGHKQGKRQTIGQGDHVGQWTVLHPKSGDHFSQADDNSVVLSAMFYGTRVLLLSDLRRSGQNALIDRTPDLRADIVVAGIPANGEPLSDALLDVIQPRAIVVSDSEFPVSARATAKLKERLARRGVPVIYTRSAGSATIDLRKEGWAIHTMDGTKVSGSATR